MLLGGRTAGAEEGRQPGEGVGGLLQNPGGEGGAVGAPRTRQVAGWERTRRVTAPERHKCGGRPTCRLSGS